MDIKTFDIDDPAIKSVDVHPNGMINIWLTDEELIRMANEGIDNPPDLGVEVSEEVQTDESLSKWKPWFNGAKHFFSVKTLPPHK